ncbi:MAG: hypothetical protein ACTHMM_00870 [Agriterribacter sp.]
MHSVLKGKYHTGRLILFLFIVCIPTLFSKLLFKKAFSYNYVQLDYLLSSILLSTLTIWLFIKAIGEHKSIDIYEQKLKVKWCWGLFWRNIYPSDITLFSPTSNKTSTFLILRTRRKDLIFDDKFTSNRNELVIHLRKWNIRQVNHLGFTEMSKFENLITGAISILFSFAVIIKMMAMSLTSHEPLKKEELREIEGALEYLSIDDVGGRSSSYGIQIGLKEYPNITFNADNAGYDAANLAILKQYNVGTNTKLLIANSDYDLKICCSIQPGFWKKYFGANSVGFYDLSLDNTPIMKLDDYNQNTSTIQANNKKWIFPSILCMIGMMAYGYFLITNKVKLNE